jgi:Flp pilus assembly protein TadD
MESRLELPPPTGDEVVDAITRGLRWVRANDSVAATLEFQQAAQLAPEWGLPVFLLGLAALDTDDVELAGRELTAAARLIPESAKVADRLALFHSRHERYADAQRVIRRALRLHPENCELWYRLAKAHAEAREHEQALEATLKALELSPMSNSKILNLYAATVDRLGDHEHAREILRELIEDQPNNPNFHFNLAYSLDLECRIAESSAAYRETLRLVPRDLNALMALANIHSGAERASCERCKLGFQESPELFDPEEAERLALFAIQVDRCETSWVADLCVDIARRIDRKEEIRASLHATIDDSEVDERVVRVERALRRL